jgi:hypothetical protein
MEKQSTTSQEIVAKALSKDNYIVIKHGYNDKYVFPYKEGIQLISAYNRAELWDTTDYSNPTVKPIDVKLEIEVISHEEYLERKLKGLLQNETP